MNIDQKYDIQTFYETDRQTLPHQVCETSKANIHCLHHRKHGKQLLAIPDVIGNVNLWILHKQT